MVSRPIPSHFIIGGEHVNIATQYCPLMLFTKSHITTLILRSYMPPHITLLHNAQPHYIQLYTRYHNTFYIHFNQYT